MRKEWSRFGCDSQRCRSKKKTVEKGAWNMFWHIFVWIQFSQFLKCNPSFAWSKAMYTRYAFPYFIKRKKVFKNVTEDSKGQGQEGRKFCVNWRAEEIPCENSGADVLTVSPGLQTERAVDHIWLWSAMLTEPSLLPHQICCFLYEIFKGKWENPEKLDGSMPPEKKIIKYPVSCEGENWAEIANSTLQWQQDNLLTGSRPLVDSVRRFSFHLKTH